jgi:hypothetical protein
MNNTFGAKVLRSVKAKIAANGVILKEYKDFIQDISKRSITLVNRLQTLKNDSNNT